MDLGMFPKSIAPSSDVLLELWFNNNHSDLKALFLFLNVRWFKIETKVERRNIFYWFERENNKKEKDVHSFQGHGD
jgi:hypothetical protein